ncbi:hypothetical protein DL771_006657 [Monosporascus sp. 5C6A]|nr:hypothetical protein DL771_006657 [Monosporascus sp. 5C6A]
MEVGILESSVESIPRTGILIYCIQMMKSWLEVSRTRLCGGPIYGVQGNPKQANYAAASKDISFVCQNIAIRKNLRRAGAQLIREKEFLGSLQLVIRASPTPAPALPTATSTYIKRAQIRRPPRPTPTSRPRAWP